MGIIAKIACAALLAAGLSGCASDPMDYSQMPDEHGRSMVENSGQNPLQCVPYARAHSRIKIYGDAVTWWDQAAGKYERGAMPAQGAVMVLHDYAGPAHGHVAVVRALVSSREIRVDHANWLSDGSIYVNDPVMDVSASNDWSSVRVFNIKTGAWGGKVYPVQGFIGSGTDSGPPGDEALPDLVAANGGGMGAVSFSGE
jgi:surface antigen